MEKNKWNQLILAVSLAANVMVIVTWAITKQLGNSIIDPAYLFKNMIAAAVIVGGNIALGWLYHRRRNHFFIGSVHFIVALMSFIGVGVWAKWFPADLSIIITSVIMFIFIFAIIWIAHYFYWKNQIKKMNEKLS
ncbi:DUF3021 family protein [Pseudalkalibacillus sp. SCS-8]|uniref:DUF3021 family protein n=1 Tax=Pseudalkalibacillus nanhaiensis TaxID=3115291 RepID=UPI0032DB4E00